MLSGFYVVALLCCLGKERQASEPRAVSLGDTWRGGSFIVVLGANPGRRRAIDSLKYARLSERRFLFPASFPALFLIRVVRNLTAAIEAYFAFENSSHF